MLGKSLKHKMKLSIIVEIVAVTLIMGLSIMFAASGIIRKKTVENALRLTDIISVETDSEIHKILNTVPTLLQSSEFYDILKGLNKSVPADANKNKSSYEITNLLRHSTFRNSNINGAAVYTLGGEKISYINGGRKSVDNGMDYCYKLIKDKKEKTGWYYKSSGEKTGSVFYACEILDPESYESLGIIILSIEPEMTENIFNKYLSDSCDIMLTYENGVIYSTSEKRIKTWESRIKPYIKSGVSRTVFNDCFGFSMVASKYIEETGWHIVLIYPYKKVYHDTFIMVFVISALAFLSGMIILFVGHRLNAEIVRPAYLLYDAMKNVDSDGIAGNVNYEEDDEYGFVIKQFNLMNSRIRDILDNNYKKQISIRNLEIKVLQSQISPHFLFNTLQSINWMAQMKKCGEVSRMVMDLSKIMEYVLRNSDEYAALCYEDEYICKYMDLIKLRYDGEILYSRHIDSDIENMLIPKFLIQPLVENCVYHAKQGKKVLNVSLRGYVSGDKIIISVYDDGKGIEPEKLAAIKEKINRAGESRSFRETKHIGLENVSGRIKMLCGEEYGINIESSVGEFTRVDIIMPAESERKCETDAI